MMHGSLNNVCKWFLEEFKAASPSAFLQCKVSIIRCNRYTGQNRKPQPYVVNFNVIEGGVNYFHPSGCAQNWVLNAMMCLVCQQRNWFDGELFSSSTFRLLHAVFFDCPRNYNCKSLMESLSIVLRHFRSIGGYWVVMLLSRGRLT